MYLNFISKQDERYLVKEHKECGTYGYFYIFWKEHLLERVQRLFVWDGLADTLPQKEIEMPLYLRGFVGVCDYKGEMSAFNGTMSGVTKYLDEFTEFNAFCPLGTFNKKINKDIVVIDNTSLRNPLLPLIHHYSILLAHNDVTLQSALINVRDSGGVPVVTTEKQKQSVSEYYDKLFKGQFGSMTDIGNMGLSFVGGSRGTSQTLKDIYEVREKLIKSFYQAIGIKGSFEKNSNSVDAEVTSDTCLLQINIHDMLECRKRGAEKINDLFGTNYSVNLAKEILNTFEERDTDNADSKTDDTTLAE